MDDRQQPTDEQQDWFATAIWPLLDPAEVADGVHVRRLHYLLVGLAEPPVKRDGVAYDNSPESYRELCDSLAARGVDLSQAWGRS
jgi:hypothetical protein